MQENERKTCFAVHLKSRTLYTVNVYSKKVVNILIQAWSLNFLSRVSNKTLSRGVYVTCSNKGLGLACALKVLQ